MNRPKARQVLDCASPLALWGARESGRGLPHSKTLSRLHQALESSWPRCAVGRPWESLGRGAGWGRASIITLI